MQIKFETKDLQNALSGITKVISSPEFVVLEVTKKEAAVMSAKEGFLIKLKFKAEIKEPGTVYLNYDVLKSIFRNRKSIEVKSDANQLHFKAGSSKDFSGSLVLREDVNISIKQKDNTSVISQEHSEFLFDSLKFLHIEEYYFKRPLSFVAHFDGKYAYCYVMSDYHIAVSKKKLKTKAKFSCSMPVTNFANILKVSNGEQFSLCMEESQVTAFNDNFYMAMPIEDFGSSTPEEMIELVENLYKQKPQCNAINKKDLAGVVSNISAVSDDKTSVFVEVSKKGLQMQISSSHGTVNERLTCSVRKSGAECDIYPGMLANFAKIMPQTEYDLYIGEKQFCFSSNFNKTLLLYVGAIHME